MRNSASSAQPSAAGPRPCARLAIPFPRSELVGTRDPRAQGLPSKVTMRARLGAWAECLKQAGGDPTELNKALGERAKQRRESRSASLDNGEWARTTIGRPRSSRA